MLEAFGQRPARALSFTERLESFMEGLRKRERLSTAVRGVRILSWHERQKMSPRDYSNHLRFQSVLPIDPM